MLDSNTIFPIRLQHTSGSVYVANVTSNTTGEVLLKEFETGVSEYEPCKLVYNGKDIRPTDTLGKLGIKVNVYEIALSHKIFICCLEGKGKGYTCTLCIINN